MPLTATAHEEGQQADALALRPRGAGKWPDFAAEELLAHRGFHAVCGADEAGRGPLAGPVAAAAVILDSAAIPPGLRDSKQLSPPRRAALAAQICASARAVAFVSLPAQAVDALNIRAASLAAMRQAVAALVETADYALIDGRDVPPGLACPASALIKGDNRSLSVAAASIIAKHRRDAMMLQAARAYPAYGFARHMGYGTAAHKAALAAHGAVAGLHRLSFSPLRNLRETS